MNDILMTTAYLFGFISLLVFMRQAWLFISNPKKFVGYDEQEPILNVWKPSCTSFLTEKELRKRKIRDILKKSSAVIAIGFLFFVFFVSTDVLFSWMPWYLDEGVRASHYVAGGISLTLIWHVLVGTTDIAWERIESDFALRRIQKLVRHLRRVTRDCDETDEYFEPQIEKVKSEIAAFINKERMAGDGLVLCEEIIGLMQCTVQCYRKQQQKAIEKEERDQDRKIQNEEKAKKAQLDKAMEEEKWVLTYNQKTTRPSVSKEFDISSLSVQEEVVIDVSFIRPFLLAKYDEVSKMLKITHWDVTLRNRTTDITAFFLSLQGTHLPNNSRVIAVLEGNEGGWSYNFMCINDNERRPLQEHVSYNMTINGLLSAVFVNLFLPKAGAFWHGLYGRDNHLIFDTDELVKWLRADSKGVALSNKQLDPLFDIPAGIAIKMKGNSILARFLTRSRTSGLYEETLLLDETGVASVNKGRCLIGRATLY